MVETSETILQEDCNLIIRGTHGVVRNESGVFVADVDLQFKFSDLNGLTQAKDTANDSREAEDGCKTCELERFVILNLQ